MSDDRTSMQRRKCKHKRKAYAPTTLLAFGGGLTISIQRVRSNNLHFVLLLRVYFYFSDVQNIRYCTLIP